MSGGPAAPKHPLLTAEWRHLVMLNYEVAPETVASWAPAGTVPDSWHGRTYLSIVGFRFLNTRLRGIAVPFHRDFEELNLRCYVRREADAEVRRAVVFRRELVPRRLVAALARALYNEPYRAVPMRSRITSPGLPAVEYAWRLGDRWHTIAARAVGDAVVPSPETLEAFITEHYWGYTRQRDGGTVEYRVSHPPWRVWHATDVTIDADWHALYDDDLVRRLGTPASVIIAEGSAVSVSAPRRIAVAPRSR